MTLLKARAIRIPQLNRSLLLKKLYHIFKSWPLHLLLLPAYFIFHSWLRFAGLINPKDVLFDFIKIAGGLILFFLCSRFYYKSRVKAAVASTVFGIIFLFFGDLKYTLSQLPVIQHLVHYKILIPLLFLFTFLFIMNLKKKRKFTGITVFLNILFLIYFLVDILTLLTKKQEPTGIIATHLEKPKAQNSVKPNIYYILLDCYPSPGYQREMLGITNNYLDSFLTSKGFYVVNESRSNYSNTAFSIASTLGLNYLTHIDTNVIMAAYHYNRAMKIIRESGFIHALQQNHYQVFNYSIFDIANQPALGKDHFLSASSSDLIFYNTMWNCVRRDLFWHFLDSKKEPVTELINKQKKFFIPQKKYNDQVLDSLNNFQHNRQTPFFLYAHLKMPHFPYFFDEKGNPYPDELVYGKSMIKDRKRFAGYIGHTNMQANKIISQILKESKGNAIIIVQSDHSIADMDWTRKTDAFRNFSAFYFPDSNYSQLYPGMSNVNTFRVILNKYFDQELPLLADKSFYIK